MATDPLRINDILELCRSRQDVAQDEPWLLQTDPLYMQHTIAAARNLKINAQMIKCGDRFEIRVCQAAVFQPVQRVSECHDVVAEYDSHPEEENKLDPAVLFTFLNDIVAVDRSAASRVDSRLLDEISDLKTLKSRDLAIQLSTKVKTRATEQADGEHVTSEPPLKEPTTILSTIALNRKSLQIFHRMFPSSEDDNEPSSGMIDWRKFVIVMTDAGFASRHNTGSAVTFDKEKGRIVSHKPHPVAKIDFRSLMRMGKHLNKWFGLERESFAAVFSEERTCGNETRMEGDGDYETMESEGRREEERKWFGYHEVRTRVGNSPVAKDLRYS